jgi:Ca2+-binding RTX toxin-like protein
MLSQASLVDGTLSFQADSNEQNRLQLIVNGTDLLLSDQGGSLITAGTNLVPGSDGTTVIAGLEMVTDVLVNLRNGNDSFDASALTNVPAAAQLRINVLGGSGDDTIIAGPGDDTLRGQSGRDRLIGLAGNDLLVGNDGIDTLVAGSGADTLVGGRDADLINGQAGDDLLRGAAGNDRLMGGAGRDTLIGGPGHDWLRGQGGSGDRLTGGPGDDLLDGGPGQDDWLLETGNVDFDLMTDHLSGAGNDQLRAIERAELNGGDGNNRIDVRHFEGSTRVRGHAGDDTIIGGPRSDTLEGGAGDDWLTGNGAGDRLMGGDGADRLDGGAGKDALFGEGGGGDLLTGGRGDDTLDGGTGVDVVIEVFEMNQSDEGLVLTETGLTGRGVDHHDNIEQARLSAGPGDSLLDASGFRGAVTLLGQDGDDTLRGGADDDHLQGGAGNDRLEGGFGNDTLLGEDGDDHLQGFVGGDLLDGGEGHDLLEGGSGPDLVLAIEKEGGDSRDTVVGGTAEDTVMLDAADTLQDGPPDGSLVVTFTPATSETAAESTASVVSLADINALIAYDDLGETTVTAYVDDPRRGGVFVHEPQVPSRTPDRGVVFPAADGRQWRRVFDPTLGYLVDWYGARGDGVGDDAPAIRRAIAAAGPGATIRFTTNQVYQFGGSIRPLEGQTLDGNGATLKRRDELWTTLLAWPEVIDEVSIIAMVESTGEFQVGMEVSLPTDVQNRKILGIDGNRLTLSRYKNDDLVEEEPLLDTVAVLFSSFHMIQGKSGPRFPLGDPHDLTVQGFVIDGNGRGNPGISRWELHNSIRLYSDNATIRDNRIIDSQSEAITVGGDGTLVTHNVIESAGGNGIHLSGGRGIRVINNTIRHTNLRGEEVGHVGGNITFSLECPDALISGNLLEDGRAAIGGFNNSGGEGVTIRDNVIRDQREYVLEARATGGGTNGRLIFIGNHCYNSNAIVIENIDGPNADSGPFSIHIKDNYFEGCRARIADARSVYLSGNEWVVGTGDDEPIIRITDSVDVRVNDSLEGGGVGIAVDGEETGRVWISGQFRDNRLGAISLSENLDATSSVRIHSIDVVAEAGQVSEDYIGVRLAADSILSGSFLEIDMGDAAVVVASSPADGPGVTVTGNIIRTPAAIRGVRIAEEVKNSVVFSNLLTNAVEQLGNGPNTVTGNLII